MLIHIITLRFSTAMDGFDDTPLTDFIKDKSVVSLREHFFIRNETPYLAIVVVYEMVTELIPNKKTGSSARRQRDETWRALLQDADMPLFEALRSWRAEKCKQDGIPPYVICNNKQLAKIAASRPQTFVHKVCPAPSDLCLFVNIADGTKSNNILRLVGL